MGPNLNPTYVDTNGDCTEPIGLLLGSCWAPRWAPVWSCWVPVWFYVGSLGGSTLVSCWAPGGFQLGSWWISVGSRARLASALEVFFQCGLGLVLAFSLAWSVCGFGSVRLGFHRVVHRASVQTLLFALAAPADNLETVRACHGFCLKLAASSNHSPQKYMYDVYIHT